jgi:TRAP-type mannitol/chloroaromatic compound transport system substrate-binding protein
MIDNSNKAHSRRSFLRAGTLAGVGAAAATVLSAPAVLAQAPIVLKMQSSWPATDIWMDMAR